MRRHHDYTRFDSRKLRRTTDLQRPELLERARRLGRAREGPGPRRVSARRACGSDTCRGVAHPYRGNRPTMTEPRIRALARNRPRLRLLRAGARVGLACALLIVPGWPNHAHAQDSAGRQFPLYVSVEGEYINTTIALRLPYQAYGQPARALASRTLDEDERLFLGFVEAVRANDLKALVKVFGVPERSPEAAKADSVTTPPRTPEQTLAIYRQSFGGFEDVRVEGRVALDDGSLFVWSANTAKGRMVRGSVVKTFGGRRQTADVTMDQPIETLIVNSLN